MRKSTNGQGPPPCGRNTTGSRPLPVGRSGACFGSADAAPELVGDPSTGKAAAVMAAPAKPAAMAIRRETEAGAVSVMHCQYAEQRRPALGPPTIDTVAVPQR